MIQARHHSLYVSFFNIYSRWMIHRSFRNVQIAAGQLPVGKPVLMIGNHFSWWDGFIASYINQHIFHKKLHIMMLEEQLRPRMFLNKAGAYSIKKGSRDLILSLRYSAGLLQDTRNLVVMYPQGEFQSQHAYPVTFERGVEKIAGYAAPGFQLVFYAALTDYFEFRKPALTIYLKEVGPSNLRDISVLESSYNEFLGDCISRQKPA